MFEFCLCGLWLSTNYLYTRKTYGEMQLVKAAMPKCYIIRKIKGILIQFITRFTSRGMHFLCNGCACTIMALFPTFFVDVCQGFWYDTPVGWGNVTKYNFYAFCYLSVIRYLICIWILSCVVLMLRCIGDITIFRHLLWISCKRAVLG